jgi:hypothetical protein
MKLFFVTTLAFLYFMISLMILSQHLHYLLEYAGMLVILTVLLAVPAVLAELRVLGA